MIIPLGHDQSISRRQWATFGIIGLCTLVQIYMAFIAADPEAVILRWGYVTGTGLSIGLVTAPFVHVGWFHLVGNMLFLYLAGSVLEDRWGPIRYVLFYVLAGALASVCFSMFYSGDDAIPLVGASGAVSALMGAFLVYYGSSQINFWYWLMYRTGTFRMTAYFALPLWLVDQIISASFDDAGGVAYTAHLGGFAFGVAVGLAGRMLTPPEEPIAGAVVVVGGGTDRFARCLAAIAARNVADVRATATRTMLELSKAGSHKRVLELYRALADAKFSPMPITDSAFAVAAAAADADSDPKQYVVIASAFAREHTDSVQLPSVLYRLAQLHRDAGRADLREQALRLLIQHFPKDPLSDKARRDLGE